MRQPVPAESVRRLVAAARSGGLRRLVAVLSQLLEAEAALFDVGGNTIALAPERAYWHRDDVLGAHESGDSRELSVREIDVSGEVVALLAVRVVLPDDDLLSVAADLAALEIGRLRAGLEGRRELAQTILEDIFADRLSVSDARSKLMTLGIGSMSLVRVLVGRVTMREAIPPSVPWNLYSLLTKQADAFVRVVIEGKIVMVIDDGAMIERVAQTLLEHLDGLGHDASVGISSAQTGAQGLRVAYSEARTAALGGRGLQRPVWTSLAQVLLSADSGVPARQIALESLKPLLDYDRARQGELVKTLETYLALDRAPAETCRALFIHPNTLRNRLRRIRSLLPIPLDSTVGIVELHLVLSVLRADQ